VGKELSLEQQEIFEFLAALLAQRRSGKLEIVAGAIKGAVFLKNGKLVDARLGHLTGFQAVNAIASLRHARFHFDPLVIPRLSSSITASERVVLKQFFGIEAADSTISSVPDSGADIDEATLARPVSIEPRDAIALTPEVIDVPTVIDVTLPNHVTNRPTDVANLISPAPFSSQTRSWASYLAVLTISAIAIAIVAAAILLKREYRERMSTTAVATVETPVNPVRPADPVMSVEPAPAPAAEDTAVNYKPTRASADLSGM